MAEWKMGIMEARFADIIWEHEPVGSTQLVKLAAEKLGWKKSTTYTVLKRLCERGYFQQDFRDRQSEEFVAESFGGSLPAFLAAFSRRKKLSEKEIAQLQELIDRSRG